MTDEKSPQPAGEAAPANPGGEDAGSSGERPRRGPRGRRGRHGRGKPREAGADGGENVEAPSSGESTGEGGSDAPRPPRPEQKSRHPWQHKGGRNADATAGGDGSQPGGEQRRRQGPPQGSHPGSSKPHGKIGKGKQWPNKPPRQGGQGDDNRGNRASGGGRGAGGERDGNRGYPSAGPRRRDLLGQAGAASVRLANLLVDRELCTRSEGEDFIRKGWIFVNGERSSDLGQMVHPACEIRLAPEARGGQSRGVTILLNKPVDYLGGVSEEPEMTALGLVHGDTLDDRYDGPLFAEAHLAGLIPVGELDRDAHGLYVLTQDGQVAQQLVDDPAIEKEYLIGIDGAIADETLAALNDGSIAARVTRHKDDQLRIVLGFGDEAEQLRKLCERAGVGITGVQRVRIGHVRLGDLAHGKWRYLRDDENF